MKVLILLQCLAWRVSCDNSYGHQAWAGNTPRDQVGTMRLQFSTRPSNSSVLAGYTGVTKHIEMLSTKKSAYRDYFNDPYWKDQWYVHDYREEDGPVMDHNVVPVYEMGFAGQNVQVAVLDDGVEHHHPDIIPNFNFLKSVQLEDHKLVEGGGPEIYQLKTSGMGTGCAGIIAMATNRQCGVGIAYQASLLSIRLEPFSRGKKDVPVIAQALKHASYAVDIYTIPWQIPYETVIFSKLNPDNYNSITEASTKGRGGKGSVYVVSHVKYPFDETTCAVNALVNHPHTLAVGYVNQKGRLTKMIGCAALIATVYSSGLPADERVVATKYRFECAVDFGGSHAATAIASGIIALVLSSMPSLRARDVTHLIAMGSEVAPLAANDDWEKNGAGFWVSKFFGFGLMNAENMVHLAKTFKELPTLHTCSVNVASWKGLRKKSKDTVVEVGMQFDGCKDTANSINFLEQIEIEVKTKNPNLGLYTVEIQSPQGTKTELLKLTPNTDKYRRLDWSFKSYHSWGESPVGPWTLIATFPEPGGRVDSVGLTLRGTETKPAHYRSAKPFRTYSAFRLANLQTNED